MASVKPVAATDPDVIRLEQATLETASMLTPIPSNTEGTYRLMWIVYAHASALCPERQFTFKVETDANTRSANVLVFEPICDPVPNVPAGSDDTVSTHELRND